MHRYVADLWVESLIQNMLWRTELSEATVPSPKIWRAPSWSWASLDEFVDFDLAPTKITDLEYHAQIDPIVKLSSV